MSTPLRFEVLSYLKEIQSRHGISEEQHIRYRQYCTRRLHRVRTAKDVKLPIKPGKKYVKQELTSELITTPKHLTISLLLAERAWAFANEDQLNIESPLDDNNGQTEKYLRAHIAKRFKKAVQHAKEFEALCEATADEYTQLQAHLYSQWMQGVKAIQDSELEDALKAFTTAKSILTGFAGHIENNVALSAICVERLQSINSYLNFCNSRLKRAGADMTALNLSLTTQDPTLLSKLSVLREQALDLADKKAQSTGENDDIVYFGATSFKILNIKVKHWLAEAKALYGSYFSANNQNTANNEEIDGEFTQNNSKYVILSTIQSHYDSAVIQLNQDLKQAEIAHGRAQTSTTEDNIRNNKGVLTYISCLKFEVIFARHFLQLIDLMYKYDVKQAIGIKTIHVMIDRLGHLIKQGVELYNNNEHFFNATSGSSSSPTSHPQSQFKSSLEAILPALQVIQKFYSIAYYSTAVAAQYKAYETNTPAILPKDFVIDSFTSIPSLSQRVKVLLALIKANNTSITNIINSNKAKKGDIDANSAFGQFALITGLEKTSQWDDVFQQKLLQLGRISSQSKVVYYSTINSANTANTTNTTAAASDSAPSNALLMDRLNQFQLGPAHNQYNVFSFIPPTQPVPAKPFVFDTAYGLIVSDNEYYQYAQQQQQPQKSQEQQQDTTTTTQEEPTAPQNDDTTKSFWSRLWG